MSAPMHSICGQDHDPAVACPPPSEPPTIRTEWGVLEDENRVSILSTEQLARAIAKEWDSVVLTRTVTTGPWTEAPPWDLESAGHDHEEPA